MKNKLTKYQFLFLLLVLSAPAIFHISPLENYPLNGYSEEEKIPEINIENWFSGKAQTQADKYLSREFGFHTDVVHFNNEWQFRLLKKANTKNVVVGKDNYLFEYGYINSYIGNNYIGEEEVNKKTKNLLQLNQLLERNEKKLVVVFAPGKGSFHPEYIPEKYFPKKEKNNYGELREAFKNSGLNFIDFNKLFLAMKDTSSYPLYPKTGIHWSEYGMTFAADSLIKYVEKLKGVDLPDLKVNHHHIENGAIGTDKDIESSLNLIWEIPNDSMAYPYVTYKKEDKDSMKVLVVADSYYWQMFSKNVSSIAFDKGAFFYYNRTFHPRPPEGGNQVKDLNLKEVLGEHEVIVLMVTEPNLSHFPWGFDKNVLKAYESENEE